MPQTPFPRTDQEIVRDTVSEIISGLIRNPPPKGESATLELDISPALAHVVDRMLYYPVATMKALLPIAQAALQTPPVSHDDIDNLLPVYVPTVESLANGRQKITLQFDGIEGWNTAETLGKRREIMQTTFKPVLMAMKVVNSELLRNNPLGALRNGVFAHEDVTDFGYTIVGELLRNPPAAGASIEISLGKIELLAYQTRKMLFTAKELMRRVNPKDKTPLRVLINEMVSRLQKEAPIKMPDITQELNGDWKVTISMDDVPGWKEATDVTTRRDILRHLFRPVIDIAEGRNIPSIPKKKKPRESDLPPSDNGKSAEVREAELAAARKEQARQPQAVAFDGAVAKGLTHLERTPPKDKVLAAELITHAARTLATKLDIRDKSTLQKAQYDDPQELDELTRKTQLHRALADMLLPDGNLYRAAQATEVHRTYNSERGALSARQQLDQKTTKAKNLDYLRSTPEAQAFLQELSRQIPGLLLLVRASVMEEGPCRARCSEYVRDIRKIDAPVADIEWYEPKVPAETFKAMLQEQCAGISVRV